MVASNGIGRSWLERQWLAAGNGERVGPTHQTSPLCVAVDDRRADADRHVRYETRDGQWRRVPRDRNQRTRTAVERTLAQAGQASRTHGGRAELEHKRRGP